MAFHNIPPNGFPDLPDKEELEAVVKDVATLKSGLMSQDVLFNGSVDTTTPTDYALSDSTSKYLMIAIAIRWYNSVASDNVIVIPQSEWVTNEKFELRRFNDPASTAYITINARDVSVINAIATEGVTLTIRGIIKVG